MGLERVMEGVDERDDWRDEGAVDREVDELTLVEASEGTWLDGREVGVDVDVGAEPSINPPAQWMDAGRDACCSVAGI